MFPRLSRTERLLNRRSKCPKPNGRLHCLDLWWGQFLDLAERAVSMMSRDLFLPILPLRLCVPGGANPHFFSS